MEIAILLSTYNGEKYLDKQLESIANQTLISNIKLYIRDDGSRDKTIDIINSWKSKINITLLNDNKNLGPSKSFWKLLTSTEIDADYYAFCDQDDIWYETKIETAIDKIKDGYVLYTSNCKLIDEHDNIISPFYRSRVPYISLPNIFVSGVVQGCSMVFSKQLKEKICDSNITIIPMHDLIVFIYAMGFGKIYWDQVPRFGYRVHSNNVVAKNNKSFFRKIRVTITNWRNSKINSMSIVAKELKENNLHFDKKDIFFIEKVITYKNSFSSRISLMFDPDIKNISKRLKRSFQIRVFLKYY